MAHRQMMPSDHFSTIIDVLQWRALHQRDQEAFTFLADGEAETESLTFGELNERAYAIGTMLRHRQLSTQRLLLLYQPGLDYVTAFLGCLYAGAIAVPAYPPQSRRLTQRLQAIAENAQAAAILTNSTFLPDIRARIAQVPFLQTLPCITTDTHPSQEETEWPFKGAEDDLIFLQYTSGSTGQPKGVMLTHRNILHNVALIQHCLQHSPASRGVIWLPLYHDMGLIGGVLGALYSGLSITLMSPMTFLQHPFKWLQTISRTQAVVSGGPNFAYELCIQRISADQRALLDLRSWEVAFCGAEPVHPDTLERFAAAFADCGFRREAFYPCYGLAEATLFVSGGEKAKPPVIKQFSQEGNPHPRTLVGCGHNLPGQQLVIVNPETLCRCPDKHVGEIWLAGPCVARGYWNAPEETRNTFQANLADTGEGPFLRTGDLGVVVDGELFIMGRLKNMLILRGVKYYAEDIEQTVESSFPKESIGRCAAFSVEIGVEERLVVALEVERHYHSLDLDAFLARIHRVIAEYYGLQVYAIALLRPGGLPRTSSGKLQRNLCRANFLANTLPCVTTKVYALSAPGTLTTSQHLSRDVLLQTDSALRVSVIVSYLQTLLANLLHVSPTEVEPQSPLHSLGLDSLMITDLKNALESQFALSFPFSLFFENKTVTQYAQTILSSIMQKEPARPEPEQVVEGAGEETGEFPLSFGQRALWFLYRLYPDNAAYNVSFAIQMDQEPDRGALQKAVRALVDRHSTLRTIYRSAYGEPGQCVIEHLSVLVEQHDLFDLDSREWKGCIEDEVQRPFDLEHGPVLRVSLWSNALREYVFLFVAHHIAVDFQSLVIFASELLRFYQSYRSGRSLTPLPVPFNYRTYVFRQQEMLRGIRGEQLWHYWQNQLSDANFVLDLPADRPRPPKPTFRGATCTFALSKKLSLQIKHLAMREEATVYMVLLAAFQVLLYRSTGQEDIVIGTPAAGRQDAMMENAIGYFVNPLPLRARMERQLSFKSFLRQVRQTVIEALEYQDYPFPLLVERLQLPRDQSRAPIFQVTFTMYASHQLTKSLASFPASGGEERWIEVEGLHLKPFSLQQYTAQFDLSLSMQEVNAVLTGSFQYSTDLFEQTTIQRMVSRWQMLLEGIVAWPEETLGKLPLLSRQERDYVLQTLNQTQRPFSFQQTLHGLFEQQAAFQPATLAVVGQQQALTFSELNQQSNKLAHYLRTLGVGPECHVGLAFERERPDMITALLAILKTGAAYVPLDTQYPADRLAFMITQAQLTVILTLSSFLPHLESLAGSARLVCLDTMKEILDPLPDTSLAERSLSEQLAYVIYTSGSTGTPKGVGCTHRNVLNNVTEFLHRWRPRSGLRWSLWTSISFDVSVYEIFLPLITGGTLYIQPEQIRLDAKRCFAWLQEHQIQGGYLPPFLLAPLHHWLEQQSSLKPPLALEFLLVGVEPIPEQVLLNLMQDIPTLHILNGYGPTETTICSTLYAPGESSDAARITPIGQPMQNVDLYVLDAAFQPVPLGAIGELYIGGEGIARGYIGRPDLTAARFVPHPWSREPGRRLYKTGDLVRWLSGDQLSFIGRNDRQVKLHGLRIEPGEIEAALSRHDSIEESLVLLKKNEQGDNALVAYLIAKKREEQVPSEQLRTWLRQQLPEYMIPTLFVWLEHWPLTPNGKLDRQALPAPRVIINEKNRGIDDPRTPEEAELLRLWRMLLNLESVGIYENFFTSGGHSLLAMQLIAHVQESFQVEVPLQALFDHPTIAEFATVIAHYKGFQTGSVAEPELVALPRSAYRIKRASLQIEQL